MQVVHRHHAQTIVNLGSVGQVFASCGYAGDVAVMNHPAYGLITTTGAELSIKLRQVAIRPPSAVDTSRP